jgi:ubiquinone/menaquinone biosynthesis C-methylase UbiE
MSTVKERLGAQAQNPNGAAGWVSAGLMVLVGPSVCHHKTMAEKLSLQADDAVPDVACGSGLFLRRHAMHVRRAAGIDQSRTQVRIARRTLRERIRAGAVEIVEGGALSLPWPGGEFTAVTCNCLNCIDEADRAVAEMFRVLCPGGRLVLAADFHDDAEVAGARDEWGMRVWTEAQLAEWLTSAGFEDVTVSHDAQTTYATARRPA